MRHEKKSFLLLCFIMKVEQILNNERESRERERGRESRERKRERERAERDKRTLHWFFIEKIKQQIYQSINSKETNKQ